VNAPIVSVVMSVLNGGQYLRQAVESILSQTFRDFEFIVIDDGSTDETWSILSDYVARDERLVLLRNDGNLGYTRSLNRGLSQAKGVYIARQDADDVSDVHRLESQVALLDANRAVGLVSCWIEVIDAEGHSVSPAEFDFFIKATDNETIHQQLLIDSFICHGSVMVRRECLDRIGNYDVALEPTEDYDLWLRLSEVAQMMLVAQPLYCYRYHPDSVSKTRFPQQHYARAIALDRALHRRGLIDQIEHRRRLARFYLEAALAKYDADEFSIGTVSLTRALQLDSLSFQIDNRYLDLMVEYSYRRSLELGLQFVKTVTTHVPSTYYTRQVRSKVLSLLYMREVFSQAMHADLNGVGSSLWRGLYYDPSWLVNLGVCSILFKWVLSKFRGGRPKIEGLERKNNNEV